MLKSIAKALLLEAVLMCGVALAQTETPVPTTQAVPPTLTVIQSISARAPAPGMLGLNAEQITPEFHFAAPNGNAVLLHREIVKTDANSPRLNPASVINIPADLQKAGAVVASGWNCGGAQNYVTLRAYIMDSDGNRSNEVQYTVHCNGG